MGKVEKQAEDVFGDYVWSAAGENTRLTLTAAVDALAGTTDEQLTFWTVISPAGEPLHRLTSAPNGVDTTVRVGDGVAAMKVQIDDRDPFVVTSWATPFDGVFHIAATVPVTDGRWKRIERWMRRATPSVSAFYLDRDEFSSFITALSEHGAVTASRVTSRRRTDQASDAMGYPKWMLAEEALDEIEEDSQVRTMTMTLFDSDEDGNAVLRLHLRRTAGATYYSGSFGLFHDAVLRRLASAAADRIGLLSGRERAESGVLPPPLVIRLDESFFTGIERTGEVIERLGRYSNGEVAVMHRNPYLHLLVADYTDGSNFDVYVTDDDEIVVYGGYKASIGSLARLTEYLSEEFAADEVAELPPAAPVRLEDLFAAG